MREICENCGKKPVAINYYKDGIIHYRSKCDGCSRDVSTKTPKWKRAGYKKKLKCERCGFSSKFQEQFDVIHIDENVNNCRFDNLRSVCANCRSIISTQKIPWRRGDLTPDNPTKIG